MSKANTLASQFLAKTTAPTVAQGTSQENLSGNPFNRMQTGPQNAFRSIFDIQELDNSQAEEIELLLLNNLLPNKTDERQLAQDLKQLKMLTAEIQSITRQSVLLLGERLFKARELLKNYGDGKRVFSEWLNRAFRARKTAYNAIAYYTLYQELPSLDLKETFKQMPQKAAYILASREGDFNKKISLIQTYAQQKQEEIISLIQDWFPLTLADRRQSAENSLEWIAAIHLNLSKLKKKGRLKKEERLALQDIQQMVSQLLA